MERMNHEYEFSVFGRVDLNTLFDEWKEETDFDDYQEPAEGWQLKYSYVFDNDICALLFENASESAATYYRSLFFDSKGKCFELVRKIRFRELESFRVDAIGINRDFSALFVCRSNETVKRDLYYNQLDSMGTPVKSRSDLKEAVLEQSDEKFAVEDGMTVLFISVPDGGWFEVQEEDPHDILWIISEDNRENEAETVQADDADSDEESEYKDIDGDGGDDDTKCHAQARMAVRTGKSAMEELHELIGLENIKERVDQIVSFAKLQKMAKDQGRKIEGINLNLSFLGNPGTAKTTVARLFARIMKENGILSKGDLIEVGRADLVAKYTGQTAIKVKGVFEKAKGNILFIDEAYSLVDGWENEYGDEAIATIVQEMENNREDMIVIFAGYPDKMEKFLSRNPGLRSRVPFMVEFKDYSADELTEIAKAEASRRGYTVGSEAEKRIHDICAIAMRVEEFGNGRFSRNLVESAIMRSASRTMSAMPSEANMDAYFTLESCDFTAPDNLKDGKQTRVIGFSAA